MKPPCNSQTMLPGLGIPANTHTFAAKSHNVIQKICFINVDRNISLNTANDSNTISVKKTEKTATENSTVVKTSVE